jgi:uncharacterized protein
MSLRDTREAMKGTSALSRRTGEGFWRHSQCRLKGILMTATRREVYVYNQTKETFLAFRVKVADSLLSRMIGLLGRNSLKPESGVWIVPCNSVHTIGMRFTIDLVLIDKEFKVVGLCELVRPFSITRPKLRAESVLELPAHTIYKSRTEIGDQLQIEHYEAKPELREPSADPVPIAPGPRNS